MKTTNTTTRETIAREHLTRTLHTLNSLMKRTDAGSTHRTTVILNALQKTHPATYQKLFTAPTTTSTSDTKTPRTARTAPINKRPEEQAERTKLFSDPMYYLAKRVVGAKIKGAIRRGNTADKNVYIKYYADMIQTACRAIQETEAESEALQYTATIPAELERDYYEETHEAFTNDMICEHHAFLQACRACGRLHDRIIKRAVEGTPLEHVSEHSTTSGYEKAITDREALKSWTQRVIDLIEEKERMKRITAKQAEDLKHVIRGHAENATNPARSRTHLLNLLTNAGLLKRSYSWTMEKNEDGTQHLKRGSKDAIEIVTD